MKRRLSQLRTCLLPILILSLLLSLPAGAEGFTPRLDAGTEGELTVVGSYSNFEALESAFERFGAYYPNVSGKYVRLDDYNATVQLSLLSPEGPDVYCTSAWMIGRDDYRQIFESAENLADPELGIALSEVNGRLLYEDEDGNVPMLPVFSTTFGMLVNEDVFEANGLAVPTTYPELLDVCDRLREAGYENPVMGYNDMSGLFYQLTYPWICSLVRENGGLADRLNAMEPEAAEFLRPVLERIRDFVDRGCVDPEACNELTDSYNAVIMRFFEGGVPMMLTNGDTVSGTLKRESQSEAYVSRPFRYSFCPVPVTEEGARFYDLTSLCFAVNRNSENLDLANEFIRFLCTTEELNNMAKIKRLVSVTNDLSYDEMYAQFTRVDADHTLYEQEIGLLDYAQRQIRAALYWVGNGVMTADEAIAGYGSLQETK